VIEVPRDAEDQCPIFPGAAGRYNWPFDDPATFTGSREDILAQTRVVLDGIKEGGRTAKMMPHPNMGLRDRDSLGVPPIACLR